MRLRGIRSALALPWVLLWGCTDAPPGSEVNLAEVQLVNLNGAQERLLEGDKRVRVVNFWATWCAPCREEMPDLQALDAMLDPNRYQVVGVTVDRDLNLVREFMLKYDIRFRQLSDPAMALAAEKLQVNAFPETFLVDTDGRVVKRVVGSQPWADPDYVRSFLGPLAAGAGAQP